MQYLISPHSIGFPSHLWYDGAFSDDELFYLQNRAKQITRRGVVGSGSFKNEKDVQEALKMRKSFINWLDCNEETEWVYQKLSHIISEMNSKYYQFDLTSFTEPLQMTNYESFENGMYGWHRDYNSNTEVLMPCRKLSLVLQLTDPSEYEGGNLEIFTDKEPQVMPKKKGLIIIFPSYTLHQVTPVTKGSRQTLVSWICGPQFK